MKPSTFPTQQEATANEGDILPLSELDAKLCRERKQQQLSRYFGAALLVSTGAHSLPRTCPNGVLRRRGIKSWGPNFLIQFVIAQDYTLRIGVREVAIWYDYDQSITFQPGFAFIVGF